MNAALPQVTLDLQGSPVFLTLALSCLFMEHLNAFPMLPLWT